MDKALKLACEEYNSISRRNLFGAAGGGTLSAMVPKWLPEVSYAKAQNSRDVIISIFLRGGADGLSLCAPYFESSYYDDRPTAAIPAPKAGSTNAGVDLDGKFAFSKSMASLLPAFNAGELLVVHATGSTDPTHSHFEAQSNMESSEFGAINDMTGWLGRHLQTTTPLTNSPVRGVALATSVPMTMLGVPGEGVAEAIPVQNLGYYGLNISDDNGLFSDWMKAEYTRAEPVLQQATSDAFKSITMLNALNFNQYQPKGGAKYPNSDFGNSMASAAALIRGQVGVEAIHIDSYGWDTHTFAGPANGYLSGHMGDFANALSAFHADLNGAGINGYVVAVMSEFGRCVKENASQGFDHGHGNVMFLMGGSINGGQVLTEWPGLGDSDLYWGQDLGVTIDYRDVLSEVVANRLGNSSNLGFVFPNYTPTFRGVTK